MGFDELMTKYEEARIVRGFEVSVVNEAIAQAFGGRQWNS